KRHFAKTPIRTNMGAPCLPGPQRQVHVAGVEVPILRRGKAEISTWVSDRLFMYLSVPHPFAFFLTKGWDSTNPTSVILQKPQSAPTWVPHVSILRRGKARTSTWVSDRLFMYLSVPHPFAFFLTKGWDSTNPTSVILQKPQSAPTWVPHVFRGPSDRSTSLG